MPYIMVGSQRYTTDYKTLKRSNYTASFLSICTYNSNVYTALVTHTTPTPKTLFVMKPLSRGGAEAVRETVLNPAVAELVEEGMPKEGILVANVVGNRGVDEVNPATGVLSPLDVTGGGRPPNVGVGVDGPVRRSVRILTSPGKKHHTIANNALAAATNSA